MLEYFTLSFSAATETYNSDTYWISKGTQIPDISIYSTTTNNTTASSVKRHSHSPLANSTESILCNRAFESAPPNDTAMSTLGDFGGQQIALKWDPKNLEIRTMSVEKTLEPLVLQVTTLVNTKGAASTKKKGKSKRASVLVLAVTKATENFIERGEQIANENPDIKLEMLEAVDEVRKHGGAMSAAAGEFSEDPCSSAKRAGMVRASRSLLSAVTRLLVLADMVDVHLLLKSLYVVENDLDKLQSVSSQDELVANMRQFGRNAAELVNQAAKRQMELKDPQLRDDLAAARASLRKNTPMLLTASKVYVRHPELDVAKQNRDQVFMEVCKAVHTISDVAQGKSYAPTMDVYTGAGELAAALDDFDVSTYKLP